MHQATRCATALLVGVLTLTGCSGRDDEPQSDPAPSEPAEPSSEPTDDETPDAPELPPEAAEQTEAGAEAFVRHYVELMNYTQATGDSSFIASLSSSDCTACDGFVDEVARVYGNGGRAEGGGYTIRELTTLPAGFGGDFGFYAVMDVDELRIFEADTQVSRSDPVEYRVGMYPRSTSAGWELAWIATPTGG